MSKSRYFPVTALGGRLYVDGIASLGPWEFGRLPYQEVAVVEVLVGKVGHRRVESTAELQAVLRESAKGLPAIRVWVAEVIEEAVRAFWEERHVFDG